MINIKYFRKFPFLLKVINVFLSNWSVFFIDFFIGVLIVKYYGSIGKGQFSALLAFTGVLAALLSMGLNLSKVYFENKKIINKDKSFTIQFFYQLLLISVLVPLFLFFKKNLGVFLELDSSYLSSLFFFIVILTNTQIFSLFLNSGFLGSGEVNKYSKLKISLVIIKLISISFFIYIGFDIVYSIILISVFEIIFISYIVFNEKLKIISLSLFNKVELKEYFNFGIKANVNVVLSTIIKRFDYFIITSLLGVSILGKYSIALIFYSLIISIPAAIHGLLYGELTKNKQTKTQILKLVAIIFLISLTIGLILMIIIKPFIIMFYGASFIEIVPVAKILIIAAIIQGSSGVFKVSLISENKSQFNIYEQLITGVFQICSMIILIEKYNLIGVAYAILIGSIISFSLRYIFYEKN